MAAIYTDICTHTLSNTYIFAREFHTGAKLCSPLFLPGGLDQPGDYPGPPLKGQFFYPALCAKNLGHSWQIFTPKCPNSHFGHLGAKIFGTVPCTRLDWSPRPLYRRGGVPPGRRGYRTHPPRALTSNHLLGPMNGQCSDCNLFQHL